MKRPVLLLLSLIAIALAACSGVSTIAERLSSALLEQNDPETVEAGAPAYLILIDGLIADDPKNEDLLLSGAKLYSAYAGVFVKDPERAKRLTAHARNYAERALCRHRRNLCGLAGQPFDTYRATIAGLQKNDVPALYTYAAAWAGWIQARGGDWSAVADLAKVQLAMERVVALDENHDHGNAHLYLGVMGSLLPPTLGGKPAEGRAHFERALELSRGQDLMVKVEYARRYARLVFDRKLHDRLLNEVLAASAAAPGLTLSNTLAQREARELLKSADKYF
ncbi:MAG: TRAP transporter TatT component family protein [Gammaproteobacteria bacterium]|nr:TRAP transporter TatT component family protein [Gammaproteobacteria bacterium]